MSNPLLLLPMLLVDAPAVPDPNEHRLRLHARSEIIAANLYSQGGDYRGSQLDVNVGRGFAFGVGYAVIPHLLLGSELDVYFGHDRWDDPKFRVNSVGVGVRPYIEYRVLPAARVQPYVLARGAVGYRFDQQRTEERTTSTRLLDGGIGGAVGLHGFVRPRLSLDAEIGAMPIWSRTIRPDPPSPPPMTYVALTASFGISGWF